MPRSPPDPVSPDPVPPHLVAHDPPGRAPLSAVVVSCNRAWAIATCLAALAFADQVILVDKSSTDGTAEIGARHADQVIRVPWSPTVEETRAFAVAQCAHEWVLLLDDDECLDPEAVLFIVAELAAPRADVYLVPRREYILGRHDERCYYWPEWHPRLFRRDAVAFAGTVHRGTVLRSERIYRIPIETGGCIHHLSHRSVAEWIEKTNRYTSRPDRVRAGLAGTDLAGFAHAAITRWSAASRAGAADDEPSAVAVLRATYDIIDRLKTWEEERGLDGAAAFGAICADLQGAYAARLGHLHRAHGAREIESAAAPAPVAIAPPAEDPARTAALRSMLDALREEAAELQTRLGAEQARGQADRRTACAEQGRLSTERDQAAAAHRRAAAERDRTEAALGALRNHAEALAATLHTLQASTIWRATAPLRRFAARHRGLTRQVRRAAGLIRRRRGRLGIRASTTP